MCSAAVLHAWLFIFIFRYHFTKLPSPALNRSDFKLEILSQCPEQLELLVCATAPRLIMPGTKDKVQIFVWKSVAPVDLQRPQCLSGGIFWQMAFTGASLLSVSLSRSPSCGRKCMFFVQSPWRLLWVRYMYVGKGCVFLFCWIGNCLCLFY